MNVFIIQRTNVKLRSPGAGEAVLKSYGSHGNNYCTITLPWVAGDGDAAITADICCLLCTAWIPCSRWISCLVIAPPPGEAVFINPQPV